MRISYLMQPDMNLASFRYRCYIPGRILGERHDVTVGDEGEVIVCAKHFVANLPEVMPKLKERARVVFDVCDNHMDGPLGDYYKRVIEQADLVTVPTDYLKGKLGDYCEAVVIEDPYEYPEAPPKVVNGDSALWFGHETNLDSWIAFSKDLKGWDVEVVTRPIPGLGVTPFSKENMLRALDECDVVLLPQLALEHKLGKSTNRVVECIRRGRFVCASPIPSWEQFSPYVWIGDIHEGLEWAQANPGRVIEGLKAGQAYVRERFAPGLIAGRWERAFETALGLRQASVA